MTNSVHVPILLEPIRDALMEGAVNALTASEGSAVLLDCTFGGGGHSRAFLSWIAAEPAKKGRLREVGLDQDQAVIDRGKMVFAGEVEAGALELHHLPFSRALDAAAARPVAGLLADLGFSSDQLESSERGISFRREGPLDMRLDRREGISAYELIRRSSRRELERVIREYGEERFAGRIASRITEAAAAGALEDSTTALAELIRRAVPAAARNGRIHPATRTFQALRIAVNGELEELDALLDRVILALQPGGRAAVISFHSLEDRKVKNRFRDLGQPRHAEFRLVTRKPLRPDEREVASNPRARSARLRILERKLRSDEGGGSG